MNVLYSLFFVISIGDDYSNRPVAVSTAVIPGFTTKQACENAGRDLYKQQYHDRRTKARVTINCVAMSV